MNAMTYPELLTQLLQRHDLTRDAMLAAMRALMQGDWTSAQIAGFLIALRAKGETVDEIAAAAEVMRDLSTKVPLAGVGHLVDTCGTGGDGAHTFNISTAAAFVAAAAGANVAKHGNRSVSSKSGSADVLEAAGVNLNLTPAQVAECVAAVGVGFLFAPNHHGAMKHAIGPRREMGVRTLFNLLGPLTNPALAQQQVIGVFSPQWLVPLAEVLARLGSRHVLVVHADDGMDEISIGAPTRITELHNGKISSYTVTPEQFGIKRAALSGLAVGSAAQSLERVNSVLDKGPGPALDIVALNAGAAIYAAGISASLEHGVQRAREVIESGAAREKFNSFIHFTQTFTH
jgi:anthranilate phosphoribosyltransferase